MDDEIVIESNSMTVRSLKDSKSLSLCVMDTSKPEDLCISIKDTPYGNKLKDLIGKRLRITIKVVGDNDLGRINR
jgi:hypothetical protein